MRPRRGEGRHSDGRLGLVWSVLHLHFESRRSLHAIFREYEARVARLVKERGQPREDIKLTASATQDLFDTWRLKELFDGHIGPLHNASRALFRSAAEVDPYDSYISRVFHELAILLEEHLSVREFPRTGGARPFARLFREVSEYYPQRLRRMKELFARAQKRLIEILPGFAGDTIVLRSCFLFREEMWPDNPKSGLTRFLTNMFPEQGAAEGYHRVARSFFKAGFFDEAEQCARLGAASLGKEAQARSSHAQKVRETISELDRLASRAGAERLALQEQIG